MIRCTIARLVILLFGVLFPAYSSFKTIKERDLNSYVKWMMYWIVFALFTCIETFTDIFLSWFPIYYELKIIFIMWLASPATRGSTYLYKKFVHPTFCRKQDVIDDYIVKVREETYKQVADLGYMSCAYIVETAIRSGGGIVNHIRKSYSLSDLSDRQARHGDDNDNDEVDDLSMLRRSKRQSPNKRGGGAQVAPMYFSEIDVRTEGITSLKSVEDISSGYSSNETLAGMSQPPPQLQSREVLARSASIKARPTRITRATAITVPKKSATTDEEFTDDDVVYLNDKRVRLDSVRGRSSSQSSSDNEFVDTVDDYAALSANTAKGNNEHDEPSTDLLHEQHTEPETNNTNNQISAPIVNNDEGDRDKLKRAGKYHKKAAPEPPMKEREEGAITATLVLQTGIIKPIGGDEVFCHSPKLRRKRASKSKSRSPSPSSRSPTFYRKLFNKSPTPSKKDSPSPMAKFMGLFKHDEKRSSWYDQQDSSSASSSK